MKKHKLTQLALLSCLTLMFGLVGTAFAGHQNVLLYDENNQVITTDNPDVAYSSANTCGSCHHYNQIEQHSYHAQLGANEQVGWASWNPNHTNGYLSGPATKGKSWVQSPGHAGKW